MTRLRAAGNRSTAVASIVSTTFWFLACCNSPSFPQDPKDSKPTATNNRDSIAVHVDAISIRCDRVEFYLEQTVPQWPVADAMQPRLRAEALEHLIRRQLIANFLQGEKYAATAVEISWRLDELREELARVDQQLTDHLKKMRLTEVELKQEIAWQIAWQKFLDEKLTAAALQTYYDQHRRDFDGTEIRVAQILFAPATAPSPANQPMEQAATTKAKLVAAQLTWTEAVEQFSTAPSKRDAGNLGWIRRHEPMPEEFSKATFQLNVGEIADPFQTIFGTHLVKCLEIRPGKKLLGDVRDEVLRAATTHWFQSLADESRAQAVIKYSDFFPHLDATGTLALPKDH